MRRLRQTLLSQVFRMCKIRFGMDVFLFGGTSGIREFSICLEVPPFLLQSWNAKCFSRLRLDG